ncbi:MAG: type II secretion system protein [bacterium]
MKKLRAFTSLDLIVVIGLILVLFGASMITYSRTLNKQRDTETIALANQIYSLVGDYREDNFRLFPLPDKIESSSGYLSVVVSSPDANFLRILLGESFSRAVDDNDLADNVVYLVKGDGSEAAVVIRSLEVLTDRCNTKEPNLDQIIDEYLIRDPSACYFQKFTAN